MTPLPHHLETQEGDESPRVESPQSVVCDFLHTLHSPSYLEVASRRKGPEARRVGVDLMDTGRAQWKGEERGSHLL